MNKSNKTLSWTAIVFSIVSIVVSVIAVANCKTSIINVEILVEVLSILVTILMAWNIYQIIDIKDVKKEYSKLEIKLKEQSDNMQYKIYLGIGYSILYKNTKFQNIDAIYFFLKSMEFLFSKSDFYKETLSTYIRNVCKQVDEIKQLPQPEKPHILINTRNDCLKILGMIDRNKAKKEDCKKVNEIISFISQLQTNDNMDE